MADVSDPAIQEAYESVRSDKSEISWLLIDYASDTSNKLQLSGTGPDGLKGLVDSGKLQASNASFAYVRVTFSNDQESKREKFILVTWIGSGVRVMRKAKISVHSADVKQVLRQYSIDVAASSAADLEEDAIIVRLRKAGGASYNGV